MVTLTHATNSFPFLPSKGEVCVSSLESGEAWDCFSKGEMNQAKADQERALT